MNPAEHTTVENLAAAKALRAAADGLAADVGHESTHAKAIEALRRRAAAHQAAAERGSS